MKFAFSVLSLCFYTSICFAQGSSLKGTISDKSNAQFVVGATVTLKNAKTLSVISTTESDSKGNFKIDNIEDGTYQLVISFVGYTTSYQSVTVNGADKNVGTIFLVQNNEELSAVVVTAAPPPVTQKLDTIQYSASQYKVNPDANAQDLIAKMPGITVDNTGTVTAHGDQVKSVTVDGKKFFGDDATAALTNLPAEVIDKIQVFDKLSDQAQFTGFDDGNSVRAINIVTKANMRTGQFGRMFAGYGTDGRYSVGGNVNFFKKDRRISLIGLFNNTNQQNFSSQDLLGFTNSSGGNGRGGGQRGGGGNGNSSNNFLVGQQNGITTTNSFGLNYTDMWGKKLSVEGSYFFNNGNTNNQLVSNTQYILAKDSSSFENQTATSNLKSYNHRINFRFDYKIDSNNEIIVTPVLSFQKSSSFNNVNAVYYSKSVDSLNNGINSNTNASGNGYNINNSILYRHAFPKKGRTISLGFNTVFTKNDGQTYLESDNRYYTNAILNTDDSLQQVTNKNSNGYQLSANVAYTEPVGKKGQLQVNYSPSFSENKANTGVYKYIDSTQAYSKYDSSLSNQFDNTVTTQSTGVSYRIGDKNGMFAVGAQYQNTELKSNQIFPSSSIVDKSFNNILPNLMWRKKLSANANLRIFYRASTSAPSISQLQHVINNSNPLFVTIGNPDLKQQVGNTVSGRYTYTNTRKGTSFFANVYVQQNDDYIANSSSVAKQDSIRNNDTLYKKGAQVTLPTNLNGYLSVRSLLTYGFPVKLIKSNLNINGGFSLVKTPGVINSIANISSNYAYTTGLVIASNISQYIDFTISYSANFNVVKNTTQLQLNNNYFMQSAGIKFNLLSKKGWFIQNDLSNQTYKGLSSGLNQSYWLWNAAIGKKMLKDQRAEIRLSAFDLLKQNSSITRTVSASYIEDDRSIVLQQYFMLTFSYKLKSFGTPPPKHKRDKSFE